MIQTCFLTFSPDSTHPESEEGSTNEPGNAMKATFRNARKEAGPFEEDPF